MYVTKTIARFQIISSWGICVGGKQVGDRSNASSEVEYRGALGWMVGDEGQGVKAILNMVHHTRLGLFLPEVDLVSLYTPVFFCEFVSYLG